MAGTLPGTKRCSWCRKATKHKVVQSRSFGRDICICTSEACVAHKRETLLCLRCSSSMAKGGITDDNYCTWCQGNRPATMRRHCWRCDAFQTFRFRCESTGRDQYNCIKCRARGLPCRGCSRGMAERGFWDDDYCKLCHRAGR